MIISASYRSDIPAFYGHWFMGRLEAGVCDVVNPYNGRIYPVSLRHDDVDGFVLWSKNIGPFLHPLREIHRRGLPFVVQYTINAYPVALERSVPDAEQSVKLFQTLANAYGARVVIWRYGFVWRDPMQDKKEAQVARLAEIAADNGMRLTVCSQPSLMVNGIEPAKCIDGARLSDVADAPIFAKTSGNRPGCLCSESRDIGAYDTCPMGCAYCYAVRNREAATQNHGMHDPDGAALSGARSISGK